MASIFDDKLSKTWKKLKSDAGIKKKKGFKKSDASIGKNLRDVESTRKKFKSTHVVSDLTKYQTALDDLSKSLDEFVANKGLEEIEETDMKATEKKALKDQISTIKDEAKRQVEKFADRIKKIEAKVGGDLNKLDELDAKSKIALYDKMDIPGW